MFATDSAKIWDLAPHSAFTDLIRFKGQWLCVFREGRGHVSADGSIRVISSRDGQSWNSMARLTMTGLDLRDPKISVTPKGELMLIAAGAHRERDNQTPVPHDSLVWFSRDARGWGEPAKIGDPNFWIWRATWQKGTAYAVGYETMTRDGIARLYSSSNGRVFDSLVPEFYKAGFPNEAAIRFKKDGTALCLLRRDGEPKSALLGASRPPYKDWEWKDLGTRVGGPNFVEIPGGKLIGAVRLYDGKTRTSIVEIDPAGTVRELETLPSSGDSSYAGLVWEAGELWISYYSSHEGKSAIYLARWKP